MNTHREKSTYCGHTYKSINNACRGISATEGINRELCIIHRWQLYSDYERYLSNMNINT